MTEWTPEQIRRSYRPCSECGDQDHAGVLCPGFTVPALDQVDAAQYSAGQWAAGLVWLSGVSAWEGTWAEPAAVAGANPDYVEWGGSLDAMEWTHESRGEN